MNELPEKVTNLAERLHWMYPGCEIKVTERWFIVVTDQDKPGGFVADVRNVEGDNKVIYRQGESVSDDEDRAR